MRRKARYSTMSGSDLVTRGIYQVATAHCTVPLCVHLRTAISFIENETATNYKFKKSCRRIYLGRRSGHEISDLSEATSEVLFMMRSLSLFLQVVIILIGIGAVAILLYEPHVEGRNAHATLFQIYFNDPFLAFAYVGSIPFFVALYQAFKVLGYAGQNQVFSPAAVKGLRTIKYCAITIIGFVAVAEIIIMLNDEEDKPGGIVIGILIIFGSIVIATAAAMFERILQNAVEMKSENDLTV